LNTFLYNWKEERNDEVNKREKNTSTTITTSAATIIPTHSIRDNNNNVYAADNTNNNDPLFDRRIDLVTEGIGAFFDSKLRELPYNNALTIIDYILSMKNEINLSDGFRKLTKDLTPKQALVYKIIFETTRDLECTFLPSIPYDEGCYKVNTQNFFPWEEARKRPDRCRWKRRVQHYY
jgi:hypothetical protein